MSEARARRQNHFKSEIFIDGPAPVEKRCVSVNSRRNESVVFTPLEKTSKPMSYSREKYNQTSDIFQGAREQAASLLQTPSTQKDLSIASVAGKKNKKSSFESFFPKDPPQFHKKSQSTTDKLLPFQPKFAETTARQRVEKEYFGGFHPRHNIKSKKPEKTLENARQRKKNNLKSIYDRDIKENLEPVQERVKSEYKPSVRKHEILSSAVFENKDIKEYPSSYKKQEVDEKRRRNHLYSDLLDTSYDFPTKKPEKLLSASQSWIFHSNKTNNTL
jgi:hypothetical protein